MKKLYFILILFFFIKNINSQTSWKGTTSTNWSTASNWTAGVPVATVDAIIGDANFTGTFQPVLTATAACKSLTIGSGVKVSALTVAKNLTVSGNITIGSNGTIVHNTASIIITLKGNWSNTGTYTSSVSTTMVTFSGAAQNLTGATTFQRVTINAGSTLTLASNISISNIMAVSGTFDPTALYVVSGSGALTVSAGGSVLVQALDFATNYPLTGTITLNGTSTVKYASSVINQNITNTLTYGYLRISGGTIKSLIGNLPALNSASSTSGRIYVDAGTLDLLDYTANRSTTVTGGSVILAAGTKLKIGGTNSFPSNYTTITLAATSTVEYSGINQTVLTAAYGNLTLSSSSGAAVKTMPNSALTIAGSLTSSTGAGTSVLFSAGNKITVNVNVSLDAGTTFNAGSYSHTFKGNYTNNGVFTGNTSTVTFSGVNALLSGTGSNNFYNLTFSGTGITGSATTSLVAAGNLSTSGSGSFTHNPGGTITLNGTGKTISGNGLKLNNCIINGTVTTTANIIISGDFTVNSSFSATNGTLTMNGAAKTITGGGTIGFYALSISGSVSSGNSFTLLSNLSVAAIGSLNATAGIVTINGTTILSGTANLYDLTINSSKTLKLGSNSTLGIANTFIKTGTLNVTTTVPNTVQYNSAGSQTIIATTYHNLILANGGTKTAAGAFIVNNDFTINSGVTFSASTFTHNIYSNFTNSGIFTAGTSTIQLLGSNPAIITGSTTFNNLIVNKNSLLITVTLMSNINTINLTVTNGTVQTGTNSVTITGTRTGVGIIIGIITHSHAFVSGTAYYFEGSQNAITFTSPSASLNTVTVTVSTGIVSDYGGQECVNREYDIAIPAGTYTSAILRLHYEDNELNAFYEPSLSQFHYNTGTSLWDSIGYTTRSTASNYVEKTGVTALTNHWILSGERNVVRWNGSVSSAWENAANWTTLSGASMSNRVPTATDDAQIGSGTFTYNPIINSTQTVNILRYGSLQSSTLTINSGSLSTAGGVKGVWTSAASHILDVSSSSFSVGTNIDLSDGISGHDIQLKIGSSGSATIAYNLNQSATGSVNFTGNGTLTINGMYNYSGGNFTCGSGTVVYSGLEAQTVAPVTYNNLSIAKSAERATINYPAIINGNLTTSIGGELAITDTISVSGNISIGANTNLIEMGTRINIGGSWSNSGLLTVNNGTVNFNGSGNQSVDANTFNTLLINKTAGTLSLTGNLIINSDLTLSSGSLNLSTYTADRSNPGGTITIGPSATLKVAGTSNFPNNYISDAISTTSTVEYNGAVSQNIANINYGNLIFTNGGATTKILPGDIQVNGDFLINSGATLDADSSNITLYGNFTNSGSFLPNGSTLILNGTSKIFAGNTNLENLTAVTGNYTFTSSILSIAGDLFVDAGASVNLGSTTVSSDGDVTNKGTLISSGNVTFTGNRVQTFQLMNALTSSSTGVVNFNGTISPVFNSTTNPQFATVNINNTSGIAPSVPWLVAIACNIGVGASFDGGPLTHTFLGNFINNGTITSKGTLKFTPIPPYSAGASIKLDAASGSFTSTGIVEFGGTVAISLIDNNPTLTNVNITNINAAGITPLTNWTINQDMYISSGAIFNSGTTLSHTIFGNLTNNGTLNGGTSSLIFTGNPVAINGIGTTTFNNLTIATGGDLSLNTSIGITGNLVNNGNFTALGRSVAFNGSSASVISSTTGPITFDDLEQNKTGSTTTLSTPVIVTGDMTLIDGKINTTATNNLTLSSTATSTSGTGTSFVNGPMSKTGNSAFVFPIGKGTTWARLGITAPAVSGNQLTAEYFNTPYSNTVSVTLPLSTVSQYEYWTLSESTSGDPVQVSLYWENAANSHIIAYDNALRVAHWNGSAWDDIGQSAITASSPGNITSTSISSFSPFTLGSKVAGSLPVELISFTATATGNIVDLTWQTATEINNNYFTLERSKNGVDFEFMQKINSAALNGNSTNTLNYEIYDMNPYTDNTYYRLKQTDYNGNFKYSPVVSVLTNSNQYSIDLYPNPSGKQNVILSLNGMANKNIELNVKNMLGEPVLYKTINPDANEYSFYLSENNSLQPGVYIANIKIKDRVIVRKFIIE